MTEERRRQRGTGRLTEHQRILVALDPPPAELPRRLRYHALRWLPVLVLAVLTFALYPVAGRFDAPLLESGEVAPRDVVAPFDFLVRKSPAELAREGEQLAATVRPIYEVRRAPVDSAATAAARLFDALDAAPTPQALVDSAQARRVPLTLDEARFLEADGRRSSFRQAVDEMIRRVLVQGVAASGTLQAETAPEIVIRQNGTERVVPRSSVLTFQQFLERRSQHHPAANSSVGDQIFLKFLNAVFRPTLIPNVAETERVRADIRASVDTVKDQVRQNERIVTSHEIVSPEAHDRLSALRNEIVRRGATERSLWSAAGQILTNALVLSIFWVLLLFYRRESYGNLRHVLLFGILFAIVIAGAALNFRFLSEAPELIPIPFAAMLITVLFSGRVAMVAAAVLAVLIASQPVYGGSGALYLALVGGVAAAIGIRVVRRRTQLLSTMLIVSAAFAVAVLTVGLQLGWSPGEMGASVLRGTVNAVVSAALVGIALPLFEGFSRITTDLTLLELSDPTHPLLRRLATEAPGTYAHSIVMANLCEAACNAIGANGLLARVGCYYHDVGKLKKPQFFVENQAPGTNPHDKLKPDVSAQIIRSHVKDGIALAEEAGLPDVLKSFIPEHHGTAEITYFLDRARSRGDGEPAVEMFRYPGPRPQSVETAVTMLADGVEAALRVLNDPSPEKVRDAIEHLVNRRIESGQLAEAPLTLAQLDRVKEEFVRILTGMYHNRIDYPTATGGISAEWTSATPS
jgi:putative nucleotidyltransferase with HDIG domain